MYCGKSAVDFRKYLETKRNEHTSGSARTVSEVRAATTAQCTCEIMRYWWFGGANADLCVARKLGRGCCDLALSIVLV